MQKDIFEKALKRKVSQITFSGHRVNDDYSLNKRKAIMAVVLSAFDETAEQSVQAGGAYCDCKTPMFEDGFRCSRCGRCGRPAMEKLTLEEIELIEMGLQAWRSDCYVGKSSMWNEVDLLEEKLERMKRLLQRAPNLGRVVANPSNDDVAPSG